MKDMSFLKQNLIAHRGMHNIENKIIENTIPAFKKAIANNYLIELDVHILKDNNVVVFHDDNLKRLTNIDKRIKNYTYNELKKVKLLNTNEHIPLFKTVLNLIDGKVPIIIELKFDVSGHVLEDEVLKILKDYKGKYVIISFNPFSLQYIRRKDKNIITGLLVTKSLRNINKNNIKSILSKIFYKPDFISCNIRNLPNKKISKIRKRKPVLGWTIRDKEDLKKAKKYCDNYVCENIEKLVNIEK